MPRGGAEPTSSDSVEILDAGRSRSDTAGPATGPLRSSRTGALVVGVVLVGALIGWARSGSTPPFVPKQVGVVVPSLVPGAEGLTLVAVRGDEQVSIDLASGDRRTVDRAEDAPIDDRSVTVDEAVELVAASGRDPEILVATPFDVSADRRWLAYWRYGQLAVIDLESGVEQVIPDIRRTHFDERIELVG